MDEAEPRTAEVSSDLLRDLTRETRTAIESIVGYAELIAEELWTDPAAALADLQRIEAASDHLMSLVARLEQQADAAQEDAGKDHLTGVANRRMLEQRVASLMRTDGPISVLLVDLDHFKVINDTHGHLVGDEILQAVVERCRRAVRDSDLIARYGGDEFVLLLVGSTGAAALQVASRIDRLLTEHPVKTEGGLVPVSASIGTATRRPSDRTLRDLLERADRAMYDSKRLKPPRPGGTPS